MSNSSAAFARSTKAMTVQSEFVKRAYETSITESQKICELHNRLAKQTLDPFKGLAGKDAGNARQVLRFTRDPVGTTVKQRYKGSRFRTPLLCITA